MTPWTSAHGGYGQPVSHIPKSPTRTNIHEHLSVHHHYHISLRPRAYLPPTFCHPAPASILLQWKHPSSMLLAPYIRSRWTSWLTESSTTRSIRLHLFALNGGMSESRSSSAIPNLHIHITSSALKNRRRRLASKYLR